MKNLLKKWNDTSLILRIILGLTAGILLALTMPQITVISILGTLFVNALKAIAPVLVFILVISSLAQAANGIGKRFRTVIFLYMLSTFLASVTAVFASYVFPVTLKLTEAVTDQIPPSGIMEVFHNLLNNIVSNPIAALMNGNYIGILAWSVILGLALKELASEQTKLLLKDLSEAVSQTVRWIINFAPVGILGLVFTSVSENGIAIFIDYSRLLALLVGCMLMIALIIDPLIVAICLHRNPYPLVYRCFKESGVTAFFTRSSAANIPVNMALCERLGLDKNIYSVSIPLGATINMNGAAITITVMTLAAAHTMGISVHISTAILLSLLSTLAACGASGVAGGSLLLIPMACSLFGISNDIAMQVVGVGFIIGVIQDSSETAINSAGDVLFAATAEFREWLKEGREVTF
ncbi:serine/threonine transporter SstT [Acetivibrio ethanolgignens]|uniref:Serine/threonine transporter SstT n=1 Tax=Acetivibrio ethanolgignens TaxID=290052 RepID=A0A0V8QC22_9FIRM|nr:serine/threonine transporter SstT [Acetivibrio ethanolgignens]KSV58087.1 serine/threonine protein kinase [Acetivibrio ethanolgignens]